MADPQRDDLEAALSERIATIFDRLPELCAFSVDQRLLSTIKGAREWGLYVSAIAAYPQLGPERAKGFIGEISEALAHLLNQRPQAAGLLPGRTFARVWH